jgi:hypothetical protein
MMCKIRFGLLVLLLTACAPCPWLTPTAQPKPTVAPQSSPQSLEQSAGPEPEGSEIARFSTLPALADLQSGWNQISPGGATSCARGGQYSFFVRRAESNKLLIYFEGGGACYDAETCRPGSQHFDDSIDPAYQADNPALKRAGVFDLSQARNPFVDYNIVFVSYCTGDAFMVHRQVSYQLSGEAFTIDHVGFDNTQAVLSWTYQNFSQPEKVFVIGCSAGVVGSAFLSPYIMEEYKPLPIVVLGDSGGGYLDGPPQLLRDLGALDVTPDWIPAYGNLTPENFHTADLFIIPALFYPQNTLALLDTVDDSTQSEIVARVGGNLTLQGLIQSNVQALQAAAPNIRAYTGPGDYHCITMQPNFYAYEAKGVRLVDWLADLEAGKTVSDVKP